MILDTNIVSELCRRQPDPGVLAWATCPGNFVISAVTVDEIAFGLAWHPNARIATWFEGFLANHVVLPISADIARRAGELRGAFQARGIVRSQPDMLIAATAQIHALTVVTRNSGDFAGCGVPVLNPFSV